MKLPSTIESKLWSHYSEKIEVAEKRCIRLAHMPLEISQKAHIVQSSILPMVHYGWDMHYVGKEHFKKVRSAISIALLGFKNRANPYLVCSILTNRVQDPLLFVMISMLRTLRRMFHINPTIADRIVQTAVNFDGKTTYGPASTLKRYLTNVDLDIAEDGSIVAQGVAVCNVTTDSTKMIKKNLTRYWHQFMFNNLIERRGIPQDVPLNVELTHQTFAKLAHREQKLIALNLVGGFQSNFTKNTWDPDVDEKCPICGQVDHLQHRLVSCVQASMI